MFNDEDEDEDDVVMSMMIESRLQNGITTIVCFLVVLLLRMLILADGFVVGTLRHSKPIAGSRVASSKLEALSPKS